MNICYESTHSWGMDYKCTWGWPIWFQIFSHQIMSVHPADALEIPHFPGTFTQTQGFFFFELSAQDMYLDTGVVFLRCSRHYIMQMLRFLLGHFSAFSLDIYPDMGILFFWVFCTLYHADAPVFFGTLTQTLGLLFSGFCTCCRCSGNSAILWDIYLNTGVVFFAFFEHYIMQMLRTVLGHLLRLQGCFFWAFCTSPGHVPHFFMAVTHYLGYYPWNYLSTSCRCSGADIICVHHADAPDFPGTFSWTLRLLSFRFSTYP